MKRINSLDCTNNLKYCVQFFNRAKDQLMLDYNYKMYKPTTKKEDVNFFRNDWTTLAFRAFQEIQKNKCIKDLCIIGTSTGLDGIGAIEIFGPEGIYITDIYQDVVALASSNIKNNLKPSIKPRINNFTSFFFEAENFNMSRFDLIYENLPNLPEDMTNDFDEQPASASFSPQFPNNINGIVKTIPKKYTDYLLTSHYIFLLQAKQFLKEHGIVLCSIGGRLDISIVLEMFSYLGYEPEILVYDIKLQNEAITNIPAYAKCEKDLFSAQQDTFRFYDYKAVINDLEKIEGYDKLSGWLNKKDEIRKYLLDKTLSANEAYEITLKNEKIAHEVYLISGKLLT